MREIVFVAGEVSGDLHAAGVARALAARGAPYRLVGIGGDRMREAGVELLEHSAHLAVMGFVEVIGTLRRHWSLLNDLKLSWVIRPLPCILRMNVTNTCMENLLWYR